MAKKIIKTRSRNALDFKSKVALFGYLESKRTELGDEYLLTTTDEGLAADANLNVESSKPFTAAHVAGVLKDACEFSRERVRTAHAEFSKKAPRGNVDAQLEDLHEGLRQAHEKIWLMNVKLVIFGGRLALLEGKPARMLEDKPKR
jgi:hypothetical protein